MISAAITPPMMYFVIYANHPIDRDFGKCAGRKEIAAELGARRRIVQWICQRCGGFFILNPETNKPHPSYLIPATNEIVQEFADLLAVVASAAADNHITGKESEQIRARWEKMKSVTESFVACCEQGNFRPLKDGQPANA